MWAVDNSAVCSNIGEAYRKRQYEAYFVSKSSDADCENTETRVWLDFALACRYISHDEWQDLELKAEEVDKLLNHMIENPAKYRRASDVKKILKKSNRRLNDKDTASHSE